MTDKLGIAIVPLSGGGCQFEFDSPGRHLEVEITDSQHIVWLRDEGEPGGECQTGEVFNRSEDDWGKPWSELNGLIRWAQND